MEPLSSISVNSWSIYSSYGVKITVLQEQELAAPCIARILLYKHLFDAGYSQCQWYPRSFVQIIYRAMTSVVEQTLSSLSPNSEKGGKRERVRSMRLTVSSNTNAPRTTYF